MLGEIIRSKRLEKELSIKKLGILVDIDWRNISHIESGKYIKINQNMFDKLKIVLDIDNKEFIEQYVNTYKEINTLLK